PCKQRKGETNDDADFSDRYRPGGRTGRGRIHQPIAQIQGADPTWGGQKAPPIEVQEPEMNASEYDLVVIGSGPAGQKGAIAAAKARKGVAVTDWPAMIGGVSVHTGTIPSKTMREAIFQLTGFAVKTLSGNGFRNHGDISVRDVSSRVSTIVARETELIRDQLTRNTVAIYQGTA